MKTIIELRLYLIKRDGFSFYRTRMYTIHCPTSHPCFSWAPERPTVHSFALVISYLFGSCRLCVHAKNYSFTMCMIDDNSISCLNVTYLFLVLAFFDSDL